MSAPQPATTSRRGGWVRPLAAVLAVAAVLAIAGLGAWSLVLRRDLDTALADRDAVARALVLAAERGSMTALLANADDSVSGFAVVGLQGEVRLVVRGLAATTGSQVYAAWAIGEDGIPDPIGEFTVGDETVVSAEARIPRPEARMTVLLTLEPAQGSTAPTPPIIATGVASPGEGNAPGG